MNATMDTMEMVVHAKVIINPVQGCVKPTTWKSKIKKASFMYNIKLCGSLALLNDFTSNMG